MVYDQPRDTGARASVFWGVLVIVTIAEWVTAAIEARVGIGLHIALLLGLLIYAALAASTAARQLALALILAPLIRILALALPLPQLPQLAWYPAVAIPLFIAAWVIIRETGLTRHDLALRPGPPLLNGAIILSGLALGVAEYNILGPRPVLGELTLGSITLAAVTLTIFTGFSEELLFRGILQSLGLRVMGPMALVYVSLLFGVLHIGYLSVLDVVFVTLVGLVFAVAVAFGASLWAVTLAHGLTNLTLLMLVPLYMSGGFPSWTPLVINLALGISGVGLIGIVGVLLRGVLSLWQNKVNIGETMTGVASGD